MSRTKGHTRSNSKSSRSVDLWSRRLRGYYPYCRYYRKLTARKERQQERREIFNKVKRYPEEQYAEDLNDYDDYINDIEDIYNEDIRNEDELYYFKLRDVKNIVIEFNLLRISEIKRFNRNFYNKENYNCSAVDIHENNLYNEIQMILQDNRCDIINEIR